jgi:hypothetical protein
MEAVQRKAPGSSQRAVFWNFARIEGAALQLVPWELQFSCEAYHGGARLLVCLDRAFSLGGGGTRLGSADQHCAASIYGTILCRSRAASRHLDYAQHLSVSALRCLRNPWDLLQSEGFGPAAVLKPRATME